MININNKDIDYTEIIKNIVSSLKENFKLLLKNANFDKTFKAKIVENISGNKYKILYKGKYYTAISENELPIDKIVKVCAPQNNWSELFIVNSSSDLANNIDKELDKKLNLSGGTLTGLLFTPKGINAARFSGTGDKATYKKLITIKIGNSYSNVPLKFDIFQRGKNPPGEISVMFNNDNTADPSLASFFKRGNISAYIKKATTSTWDIYITKTEAWDSFAVANYETNLSQMSSVVITYQNEDAATLPSGYVEATTSTLW